MTGPGSEFSTPNLVWHVRKCGYLSASSEFALRERMMTMLSSGGRVFPTCLESKFCVKRRCRSFPKGVQEWLALGLGRSSTVSNMYIEEFVRTTTSFFFSFQPKCRYGSVQSAGDNLRFWARKHCSSIIKMVPSDVRKFVNFQVIFRSKRPNHLSIFVHLFYV